MTKNDEMSPKQFAAIRLALGPEPGRAMPMDQLAPRIHRSERQCWRYEAGTSPIEPLVAKAMLELYGKRSRGKRV